MANNEIKITEELRERIFKNKKTHIFYDEWCDWIISLSDADALEIARTIAYGFRGVDHEPNTPTAKVVMLSAKKLIDADRDKYLVKTAKQIDALDKANATRHDEAVNGRLTARSTAVNGRSTDGQRTVNGGDMVLELDSVLDSDMDMDMDKDMELDNNIPFPSGKGFKKKDDKSSQKENRIPQDTLNEIIARWNTLPDPVPRLTTLKAGTKRYESLSARLSEYGTDDVMIAIEKVRRSSFLCGRSSTWHISFDWFVLPNNFPKVLDGNYTDSEQEQKPKSKGSMIDEWIEKGLLQ